MTAPSALSSIIAAIPDDDGGGIDDPKGLDARIDNPNVETQPSPQSGNGRQPEPIRPIEYLMLHNARLEWAIRDGVDEAVEKRRTPECVTDTEEWAEYEKVVSLGLNVFQIILNCYWYEADSATSRSGEPFKWQKPCIVLIVATDGLSFSTEDEMLEYFESIPACPHPRTIYDWSATRIIKERAIDGSASNRFGDLSELPENVTCGQIRQWMIDVFTPSDHDKNWPKTDDQTVQRQAFDKWIRTGQAADLADRVRRYLAAGRNIELYKRLGRRRDRATGAAKVDMLVDELVPAGMVTLLVGAQEVGKSTIATELAVAVATGRDGWLGRKINQERAQGLAILLTGEDGDAVVNGRLGRLDPTDQALRMVVYALDGRPLADILAEIKDIPKVSLIVIDPARRYLRGDEDSSANVDEFFAALDEIARHTRAAVLVLHHLRKDASPTSLGQVRDAVRGSAVFLDRPRVALGCFRLKRDDVTVIGRIKSNLPPDHPISTEIRLHRDGATLRHIPVQVEAITEVDDVGETDELDRKVLDAITRLTGQSDRITRAGGRELWALRPPELDGIGRNRIRDAVDRLVDDGVLIVGAAGIEVAS